MNPTHNLDVKDYSVTATIVLDIQLKVEANSQDDANQQAQRGLPGLYNMSGVRVKSVTITS